MKNRKYIPNESRNPTVVLCIKCLHEKKCIGSIVARNDCNSFKKRAGIR